jgi:hypothetical protein
MGFLSKLDDWSQLLFISIFVLFLFMMFFKLESISDILTEGLMNMQ